MNRLDWKIIGGGKIRRGPTIEERGGDCTVRMTKSPDTRIITDGPCKTGIYMHTE